MQQSTMNHYRSTAQPGAWLLGISLLLVTGSGLADRLTLQQAEQIALTEEPGLISQQWQSKAMLEQAIADGQHMDPKLQLGILNLPTDTFDMNQEPVTQVLISYQQQFPPGDTRFLKQQKAQKQAALIDAKLSNRSLTILRDVRQTYLEILYLEQAKNSIIKNKRLFAQLLEVVQSLFSVGRNNQQDLIRAQLELSRLDDRLTKIEQQINTQRSRLSRWIGTENSLKPFDPELPYMPMVSLETDFDSLSQQFLNHPQVQEVDRQLELTRKDIQLVNESLKPGWGLTVSYGYREDAPNGMERADFVSAVVAIDLPLFSANRQDKKRLSKEYEYQSLKSKRTEVLRQLVSELLQEITNELLLQQRLHLYSKLLLPQAKQQTQASMLAYQSDKGRFSDVMRAYIDDLNANLDEHRIAVDIRQSKAKILYYVSELQSGSANQ
ncbi:MAG: TolC family protein [Gammaproteobacteria bacterium]|nr:TolC family protein [Gammaproteobacteria bacterium]